jgi:ferredoxin, 2Fe-2S
MTRLIVTTKDGREVTVDAIDGLSVMEVLRPLDFGIVGDCEGSVACASCHVWVDGSWDHLPEPSDDEAEMLDCAFHTRDTSRLSCQIRLGPSLDGLRLAIPHE